MRKLPPRIDFTRMNWRWRGLPADTAAFLSEHGTSDALICIKQATTRAVYRIGRYFLKVDWDPRLKNRLFPAARSEYKTAQRLAAAGIGTVRHLGWGRSGRFSALVTEVWHEDAEDVFSYWYKHFVYDAQDPAGFLAGFAAMLRKLLSLPLHHGDFHLGNILYSPGTGEFTLVDLHHVKTGRPLTAGEKLRLLHVVVELRAAVRPQTLLQIFWDVAAFDADTAAAQLRKMLTADLLRAQRQWPRRERQLLNGYPKFSEFIAMDGQMLLVRRNMLRQNIFDPAAARRGEYRKIQLDFPAALEQFLFSFWLSLLQVPHVPAAALAANGTLYFPRLPKSCLIPTDRELVNDFNEYLLCLGLNLEDYQCWRHCSGTRLIVADFTSMLACAPDRERFRRHVDPARWRK